MTPKRARRVANLLLIAGGFTFAIAAAVGSNLAGSSRAFTHSPAMLVLLIPVAMVLASPIVIFRYWRCASCGALLPGINQWSTRAQWHCLKCKAPFDLS